MKIKEWYWKNFMSYGNIDNKIELLDGKGELILLVGKNGQGKTGLTKNLDFSFFGECLNDRGKKFTQKLIPNRDNGNMSTGVKFISNNNEECEIKRSLVGSLKSELYINNELYKKAGKIQDKIEELIGYDFESYKSFISLNMNVFKDFINLTPEDKRKILDKLFNLQVINELNKVLKQLKSQNDTNYNSITKEISIYDDQILMLKESIEKASNIVIINNNDKIKELKELIKENKITYTELEETKNKLDTKLTKLNDILSDIKIKKNEINRDIKEIDKQLDLFNSGKCPTCGTDLSIKLDIKTDLEERKQKTLLILDELNNEIEIGTEKISSIQLKFDKAEIEFNKLTELLLTYKTKISTLSEEQESSQSITGIDIFNDNLLTTQNKLKSKKDSFIELQKLKYIYDILTPVWGENGIKRDILDNIIGPINDFIKEDLSIVGSRFDVELDNNFDVHITEWGTEIDSDTLSTGEAKKVNIVIMLAYVKMNRLKNSINLLVLDELFAGLDVESVDYTLQLLKKMANERNINIIVVHHSELNKALFDRIIKIEKTHFSYIIDERIE